MAEISPLLYRSWLYFRFMYCIFGKLIPHTRYCCFYVVDKWSSWWCEIHRSIETLLGKAKKMDQIDMYRLTFTNSTRNQHQTMQFCGQNELENTRACGSIRNYFFFFKSGYLWWLSPKIDRQKLSSLILLLSFFSSSPLSLSSCARMYHVLISRSMSLHDPYQSTQEPLWIQTKTWNLNCLLLSLC